MHCILFPLPGDLSYTGLNPCLPCLLNFRWILYSLSHQFSSVQFSHSVVSLYDPMDCTVPGLPVHHQLLELSQTHVLRVSDAIQPSPPLSPLFLQPSIFPSFRVFSNKSVLHIRWPKYCLREALSSLVHLSCVWEDLLTIYIFFYLELPSWLRKWRIFLKYWRLCFDPWVRKIPWKREWLPL